ncbi:hypothetical protein HFN60_24335 [Rhizobium leguminosarum]|nr:hypothetical protein [Rhizobium leguminosarum]
MAARKADHPLQRNEKRAGARLCYLSPPTPPAGTGSLSATPDLIRNSEGKLELFTSAYDDDPREVWEIKRMIRWVKSADKKGIPWFFFCNKTAPHIWLRIYAACLCDARREGIYEEGRKIKVSLNPKKISKLLDANFLRLNQVCEAVGVSENEIRRISFASAGAIGLEMP